jgi:hypothetical protein
MLPWGELLEILIAALPKHQNSADGRHCRQSGRCIVASPVFLVLWNFELWPA